jgi:hypothetical protein
MLETNSRIKGGEDGTHLVEGKGFPQVFHRVQISPLVFHRLWKTRDHGIDQTVLAGNFIRVIIIHAVENS